MKKSLGLYLTALAAIAAVVSIAAYVVNCGTDYFMSLGTDPAVLGCIIAAIAADVVYIAVTWKGHRMWSDILPVAAPALLTAAVLLFANSRIYGIASIMTFDGNAQNMADLASVFVSIAAGLIAVIVGVVAAFFDTVKE